MTVGVCHRMAGHVPITSRVSAVTVHQPMIVRSSIAAFSPVSLESTDLCLRHNYRLISHENETKNNQLHFQVKGQRKGQGNENVACFVAGSVKS